MAMASPGRDHGGSGWGGGWGGARREPPPPPRAMAGAAEPPRAGDAAGAAVLLSGLLAAGVRLAEALDAENKALAALDLPRAASLAETKIKASDAFAAAHAAAARTGARAGEGEARRAAEALAAKLQTLGTENRRLLERAVAIQSRVIETIAGAALPRAGGAGGYAAAGRRPAPAGVPALAVMTRA